MKKKRVIIVILGTILSLAVGLGVYASSVDSLPDASYALFDEIKFPTSAERIMVVSPHQDDETIGAAAYIRDAVNNGAVVEVIFATDGNKHGLKDTRHQEALDAGKVVGLTSENSYKFFDFPDGSLNEHKSEFEAKLADEITSFKPTRILTTMVQDIHPDHLTCGQVVDKIHKNNPTFIRQFFLVHYHRYPRPIGNIPLAHLLPPISLLSSFDWQVYPTTLETTNIKVSAISKYKSQLKIENPVLSQLMYSFARQNELFAFPIEN